ncbi:UNVERIFIED_CONTAM: hypothetical protein Slati_2476600 [Sesamum latifolium]|uniref:Retrotransposon gag domain-containing protein n=1 Tax=Sesamum latifolium TaxID=2727402 RepID=A0AAW2WH31_9LAMI
MYRDKKRMEFLNLVQGDDQTVAEYELRFAALAKYAPEAVVTQEDRCYRFEQGLRPEIRKGLAVRIINFKTLVESAVRMEEAVIEEKKKREEKRKLAYTVGESSRSTKRGTGRSFSAGGGNFSRGGPTFRGNNGPRFSGPVGLTEVRSRAVHLLCLLLDQVEELDRVTTGGQLSLLVVLLVVGDIWDNIGDQMLHSGFVITAR